MGYRVHQNGGSFRIAFGDIPKALDAAQRAGHGHTVACPALSPVQRLVELFAAWRWRLDLDPAIGDVVDVQFEGEMHRRDDELFRAIAPFVAAGSHICMVGEDDEAWRWYFDGQEMVTQPGTMTYAVAQVVIEVRGGVAEVTESPPGVEVHVIDHDNLEAEP